MSVSRPQCKLYNVTRYAKGNLFFVVVLGISLFFCSFFFVGSIIVANLVFWATFYASFRVVNQSRAPDPNTRAREKGLVTSFTTLRD